MTSDRKKSHALVIGGSIAGLITARILTNHFERVTIVERDQFPHQPQPRKGVPQGHHVHILLAGGLAVLQKLFPHFVEKLDNRGAIPVNIGNDARVRFPSGWIPQFTSAITVHTCSRPLLEWQIFQYLHADEKIEFVEKAQVTGLQADSAKNRAIAVKVIVDDREQQLSADFIVDTSGRNSAAPQWLEALGYPTPFETNINAQLRYSSCLYAPPSDFSATWKLLIILPRFPDCPRGGVIFPIEQGQWLALTATIGSSSVPNDPQQFLEQTSALTDSSIYEALRHARPLSSVYNYRRTANHLRHYENLSRRLDNFIVLGDAFCAFNPYYGQGMASCALQAEALDKLLVATAGNLCGIAEKFQQICAQITAEPWRMAVTQDLIWPETEGGEQFREEARKSFASTELIMKLATQDVEVAEAFHHVMHLLRPGSSLDTPEIHEKLRRISE